MVEQNLSLESVFRALGDPTRLRMIERLSYGPHTIGELAAPLDMTLAGASKHVGVLEAAGLIMRERKGRARVCTLSTHRLQAARQWVERYSVFWNERFDEFEVVLERTIRKDRQ